MKDAELRKCFRQNDLGQISPFRLLQEISMRLNRSGGRKVGVEFLMRALEHREAFEGTEEILDALLRSAGLFPYANRENLSLKDRLAYEFHRPINDNETVFHRVQAQVYRRLISGENLILSAPTSFGKSRIVDYVIEERQFKCVVIVVPTLALIDETRRRVSMQFGGSYRVISHQSQELGERNIFVLTPERVISIENLPRVDFFVIDEFYKVGIPSGTDDDRFVTLNHAFYKLLQMGGQFYLLGPNVDRIPVTAEKSLNCHFIATDYATVATDQIRIRRANGESENDALVRLCKSLVDQTLIYCASPQKAAAIARLLVDERVTGDFNGPASAVNWLGKHYSSDWVLPLGLSSGIGIHHGRLPRSIGQYVVRAFNRSDIRFLVCTSSLIEGVNTDAKNVIIFNRQIARRNFDFFTFNNIAGRSGRMFKHFVGRVFLFHEPPANTLPFIDFPFLTQDNAPESLLVQIDENDLTDESVSRMSSISSQRDLPIEVLRLNSPIAPDRQIELARVIKDDLIANNRMLSWRGFPTYDQLEFACRLIWEYLAGANPRRGGILSSTQLAYKIYSLRNHLSYPDLIESEMQGNFAAPSADDAIDRIFDFERSWASFHFPRCLAALERIQEHVFLTSSLSYGDYSFFVAKTEALHEVPVFSLLDEFGLPLPLLKKLEPAFNDSMSLDDAIEVIRTFDLSSFDLDGFEIELIKSCREGLIVSP